MKILKGSRVTVKHSRKGIFRAVAIRDFDIDEEWYPLATAEEVHGISQGPGNRAWGPGEPCRASFVRHIAVGA